MSTLTFEQPDSFRTFGQVKIYTKQPHPEPLNECPARWCNENSLFNVYCDFVEKYLDREFDKMKIHCKSICDLGSDSYVGDLCTSKFTTLLKYKWNEALEKPNVFRYKIDNMKERLVESKKWNYILLLNPDRALNRREPEFIRDMNQPFDKEKFNFTKVLSDEILFSVGNGDDDPELHSFIVNVSPISKYHSLFCPFINQKLPQAVTYESLEAAVKLLLVAKDCNLKMCFNSLCAMASVNHLHFHLMSLKTIYAVEKTKKIPLKRNLFCLAEYPVPAFFMTITEQGMTSKTHELFTLIKYLQRNSIAHNLLLCLSSSYNVDVYIFPRKSTAGVKDFRHFNVAVLEFSGFFPVFSNESFTNLTSEDVENEMMKWKYEEFEKLCEDVTILYV